MCNNPLTKTQEEDDNDDIKERPKMAVMIQPVNDQNNDNAAIDDNDDDKDGDDDDDDKDNNGDNNDKDNNGDDNDEDNNQKMPSSANTKTLNAMKKLVTSYNLYMMDYVDRHLPSDDASEDNTVQQDNRSGREEEEDDKVKEVASDEQIGDLNLASLVIDPLPDFAFYTK